MESRDFKFKLLGFAYILFIINQLDIILFYDLKLFLIKAATLEINYKVWVAAQIKFIVLILTLKLTSILIKLTIS